jgi:hypothetical protein
MAGSMPFSISRDCRKISSPCLFPSRTSGLTRIFSQEANQKVAWNLCHQKREKSGPSMDRGRRFFCEVSFYGLADEISSKSAFCTAATLY